MIPDFTESEILGLRQALAEEFDRDVEIELTHSDVLAGDGVAAQCPTIGWYAGGANYVLSKTGSRRYRSRFYFTPHEQYGTEQAAYAALDECLAAVLDARKRHRPSKPGAES